MLTSLLLAALGLRSKKGDNFVKKEERMSEIEIDRLERDWRAGERHVANDGLAYSNMGFGIKCVFDAWVNAHGESTRKGIPEKSTDSWLLMKKAMIAIDALIDAGHADMDAPCFTDADGSNPYYSPIQYLCVLDKCILRGDWAPDLARKMHTMGAHYEHSEGWDTDMKDHATMLLTVSN